MSEHTTNRSPTTDRPGDRSSAGDPASRERSAATDGSVDRSPALASAAIATGFAVLGALAMPTTMLVGVGIVGSALVGAGALLGARRLVSYGTVVLLAGVILGGLLGAPLEPLVVSTLLSVLAWDGGRYGITIGEQLGRGAQTLRIELAHSALNTVVGVAGAGLGYAAYRLTSGGQPVAALFLLLVGAVILVVTLE